MRSIALTELLVAQNLSAVELQEAADPHVRARPQQVRKGHTVTVERFCKLFSIGIIKAETRRIFFVCTFRFPSIFRTALRFVGICVVLFCCDCSCNQIRYIFVFIVALKQ